MSSDGKKLEDLVAFVERTLAPQGLTVSTNERVFNHEGVQIAEFDVEVRGKFGTTEIYWLIECRDRPGYGPAPSSWIEQLVGRRDRFGFNKVTAVSTTAFAAGAVDYAKRAKIELREVASLSPESFLPWLPLRSLANWIRTTHLLQATLVLDACETEERTRAVESLLANSKPEALVLRSTKTGVSGPLSNAFMASVEAVGGLFDDVVANGPAKRIELTVNYVCDDDHFVIEGAAGAVRVRSIIYAGELSIKANDVPVTEIAEYRGFESDRPISQVVSFAPQDLLGIKTSVELHRMAETGEVHLVLRKPQDDHTK